MDAAARTVAGRRVALLTRHGKQAVIAPSNGYGTSTPGVLRPSARMKRTW